jgi:DnaJ-class molecular chaperone
MEQEDLLTSALSFFGLEPGASREQVQSRYRELAKKYHPDSGEFTSDVLFLELSRSYQILSEYSAAEPNRFSHSNSSQRGSGKGKKDPSYEIYKTCKEKENKAILRYFEKTKGNTVHLNPEENPPLRALQEDLDPVCRGYRTIISEYPESIWVADAKASIKRLGVWIRS